MYRLIPIPLFLGLIAWFLFFSGDSTKNLKEAQTTELPQEASLTESSIKLEGSQPTKSEPKRREENNPAITNSEKAPPHEGSFPSDSDESSRRIARLGLTADGTRPSLGLAYRDRRGLVWGEIKRMPGEQAFNDSTSLKVSFQEAGRACKENGNRLPTRKEYERLVRDFGVEDGDGYIADPNTEEFAEIVARSQGGDMLPNGGYNPFRNLYGEDIYPTLTFQRTWTSTLVPGESGLAYVFNSAFGIFQMAEINTIKNPFLCVYDSNGSATKN
jgi:hypothetical protein